MNAAELYPADSMLETVRRELNEFRPEVFAAEWGIDSF